MAKNRNRGKKNPTPQGTNQITTVAKKVEVKDTFQNPIAKLGLGLDNLFSGTNYLRSRFTQDYNLMVTLYRTHWVVKRIIDVVPNDMTKKGIKIVSDLPNEVTERIYKCMATRKVLPKINEGLRWGRLFGGAGALMLIEGHDEILDQPLDLDSIMINDFKGLLTFDRWSGIYPLPEMVDDLDSPELGLPKYYRVTLDDNTTITVHHSRILRFAGRLLPRWEQEVEMYWGASEIEAIFEELAKRDNTSFNIAQLVFLANLRILKMNDLGDALTLNDHRAQEQLYDTLYAQNVLLSNFGLYVMNKDDEFDTKAYSFAGLAEIMEQFMLDLSGATGIPSTRLWGRAPQGMNATGESDMQLYYELINENQETYLRDNYNKLLPVMFMSELGYVPDDYDFEFESISTVPEEEIADLINRKTTNIKDLYDANLITQLEAREELKTLGKQYNMFTNIGDDVEADSTLSNGVPDFTFGDFDKNKTTQEEIDLTEQQEQGNG